MGEFDLIERYFRRRDLAERTGKTGGSSNTSVVHGIGDDCAVLQSTPGMQWCISSDMLVQGRHFFADVHPKHLGHKALAVNLSDLAACGAQPRAFTLALALPQVDEAWLEGFSQGLFALADAHDCILMGGDTSSGPLNICITVFGEVPAGDALLRSGAKVGDDIYVSGTQLDCVGQARCALEILQGRIKADASLLDSVRHRLELPTPRVSLGMGLRGIATACIDLSDGLLGDLGHILTASHVGALVQTDWIGKVRGLPLAQAHEFALAGGDDYELLFTAPPERRAALQAVAQRSATVLTRVGQVTQELGLRLLSPDGQAMTKNFTSFEHFGSV